MCTVNEQGHESRTQTGRSTLKHFTSEKEILFVLNNVSVNVWLVGDTSDTEMFNMEMNMKPNCII